MYSEIKPLPIGSFENWYAAQVFTYVSDSHEMLNDKYIYMKWVWQLAG